MAAIARYAGSSPRVRGTPNPEPAHCAGSRFIPACAGNAVPWATPACWQAVHPRVCGERLTLSRRIAPARGSSPRVRGTPGGAAVCRRHGRFIPACAGNAAHGGLVAVPEAVHPRVCGERARLPAMAQPTTGSSPRVRGTHFLSQTPCNQGRFIPACAGNAPPRHTHTHTRTVHPRVCGERPTKMSRCSYRDGSSPRVRGTHFIDLLELPEQKRGHRIYRDAATPTRTWSFKEAFG